ncbi:hypothetical protein DERF_004205 [Dermatophagoides farinae]|uniref:Uncharacterized protein n=1 Tax=Dermatophagoides farinae TaxID=6954 RepID=A0A922I1Y3_DERFA|nr:hypothetical protein DERF_004205 [Dermatophagoides farinae]
MYLGKRAISQYESIVYKQKTNLCLRDPFCLHLGANVPKIHSSKVATFGRIFEPKQAASTANTVKENRVIFIWDR